MNHARIAQRYINTWFVVCETFYFSSGRKRAYDILITMQVDVISSVPVEMMYSEEDMDKAGFMRLNKVILAISFP